jgi:adenylate cyclase
VAAARDVQRRIADANRLHPTDDHLFCAIGIGFGDVLWLGDREMHGQEVNLASKLGEDIARESQILLTSGARAAIDGSSLSTREATVSISGLELTYHEIVRLEDEL